MTASEVLREYWDGKNIPIPLHEIAAKLKVFVLGDPNMSGSGHYTPHCEHLGGPLITFNPSESPLRIRFTIAHELGHHCMKHGECDRNTPPDFMSNAKDWKEVSANRFAAELLMPEEAVRALVEVRKIHSVQDLAKMFQVSKFAMLYRLEGLGYVVNR